MNTKTTSAYLIITLSILLGCDEHREPDILFIDELSVDGYIDASLSERSPVDLNDQSISQADGQVSIQDMSTTEYDSSHDLDSQPIDFETVNDQSIEFEPDQSQNNHSMDMGESYVSTPFTLSYWSATHNSYEGEERGTIIEQLNGGVRALEYDIHDNDFQRFGYRLGHLQFGDAVAYGNGNPTNDSLENWLDLINTWSNNNQGHAPLILTIDLKDNLMDNRSYAEGNLAHLNHILESHLDRIWRPNMGLDDINLARDHIICVLSGDADTRKGYLHDEGRSPALSINDRGDLLEVHDSGAGNLWYWSGAINGNDVIWKRHGRYDSGQRPAVLLHPSNQVIEVHQSESRNRLWASTGTLSAQGELSLNSARDFCDGTWPSLKWLNTSQGEFSLRYERSGRQYERRATANFTQNRIDWEAERELPYTEDLHDRNVSRFQEGLYQVSHLAGTSEFPENTLWLSVSAYGVNVAEMPIRYEQVCSVEWQRNEYNDSLLGLQVFGALPSGDYSRLPQNIKANKIVRAWEYSGRNPSISVPQIPSVDYPFREDYQIFMEALGALE